MFAQEFEKSAGIPRVLWNTLKGMVTGKATLYHGTSAKNARNILKNGLIPNKAKGATVNTFGELNSLTARDQGLSFLARDLKNAKKYSKLHYPLKTFKNAANKLGKIPFVGEKIKKRVKRVPKSAKRVIGSFLSLVTPLGTQGKVLEIKIPKDELRRMRKNPPIELPPGIAKKVLEINQELIAETTVNRKIPSKYIKDITKGKK